MKQGTVKYSGSRLSFAPLSVPSTFSTAVDPFRLPLTVVVWLVMCSVMIPRYVLFVVCEVRIVYSFFHLVNSVFSFLVNG